MLNRSPLYIWGSEPLIGNGDHFYTINHDEAQSATMYGYHYEGLAGFNISNQPTRNVPLYRLFGHGDHFYTANEHAQSIESHIRNRPENIFS